MPETETPSAETVVRDGAKSEARSSEGTETREPSLLERIFPKLRKVQESSEPKPATTEPSKTDGPPSTPSSPETIVLTQEELDRRVQAETDRREAKRKKDAEEAAEAAERKRLRDEDPVGYVEKEKEDEQRQITEAQFTEFVKQIGTTYDAHTLDPLKGMLTEKEIADLEQADPNMGNGLEGRKMFVEHALETLKKRWKEEGARDAETRLRKNGAFKKQLFAELRPETEEPELVQAGSAPSNGDPFMEGIFGQYRAAKYRKG